MGDFKFSNIGGLRRMNQAEGLKTEDANELNVGLLVSKPREINKNVIFDETYHKWYTKGAWERAIREGRVRLPEEDFENEVETCKWLFE